MALNWFVPEQELSAHFAEFYTSHTQVGEWPNEKVHTDDFGNRQWTDVVGLKAACWVVLAGTPRRDIAFCRDFCLLRYGECGQEKTPHCNIHNLKKFKQDKEWEPDFRIVWKRMTPGIKRYESSLRALLGPVRVGYFVHWLATQCFEQERQKPKKERPKEPLIVPELPLITIADLDADPWFQFMAEKRKEKVCSPSWALPPSP
jgi:hypothetical protein